MSNINANNLDSFFSYVSKAVLVVPIIIIVVALVFKFNNSTKPALVAEITPTPTPTVVAKLTQNNDLKFDLTGPITCQNLSIKNRKIYYKNSQTNYLLSGDCLYQWQTGKYTGEKKCGLTGYIGLAESYLSSMNINDLINNSMVAGLAKNKGIDLANILNSCKRGEIKDESIFEIPKQVLFKNK